jgi:hypothetical protein
VKKPRKAKLYAHPTAPTKKIPLNTISLIGSCLVLFTALANDPTSKMIKKHNPFSKVRPRDTQVSLPRFPTSFDFESLFRNLKPCIRKTIIKLLWSYRFCTVDTPFYRPIDFQKKL